MVARITTVAFAGVEVLDIDVQVQMGNGLPAFTVVGLPDKAVAESRERVRAALAALGLALPPRRITVNLAPADLQKEGSHFDLPIALGLLVAMGVLPGRSEEHTSELQSLMRTSYAVFCLKKKTIKSLILTHITRCYQHTTEKA